MAEASSIPSSPLVLIVEDDQTTRLLYRECLNDAGLRTVDAHNGFQALQKVQDLRPDAIVTDLAVPGMDGFEFCRTLRQSRETRDIPVLAVTGHQEYLVDPERLRHAGISRVLLKPCDPDTLVEEVRRLLNGRLAAVVSPPAST